MSSNLVSPRDLTIEHVQYYYPIIKLVYNNKKFDDSTAFRKFLVNANVPSKDLEFFVGLVELKKTKHELLADFLVTAEKMLKMHGKIGK